MHGDCNMHRAKLLSDLSTYISRFLKFSQAADQKPWMQVLTVMVWMDAVELNGTLMTDSTSIHSEFLQNFRFFFSSSYGILAEAPPAGVFGGRKQDDNRGQLIFN